MPLTDPLHESSVVSLATAIRAREISSEELVGHFLDRIDKVNGDLNAVVQLAADRALEEARAADQAIAKGEDLGPLHGVPMTIKDSLDTEGVISTGGTKGRTSFVPKQDATVVARLRGAGAILLGKTNTPELTLSYETHNLIYGRTRNPYDLSKTPGGSSGGAAAILAAGGSAFDIGSDYGGSVRVPSHCCGTAGIKPTSGRVPRTGHIFPPGGLLDAFQQIGPMARYVGDLHGLLEIIAGPDGVDPAIVPVALGDPGRVEVEKLRILLSADNGVVSPVPAIRQVVASAAEALATSGVDIEEGRSPGEEQSFELATALWAADGGASTRRLLQEYGTEESSLAPSAEAIDMAALDALIHRWDEFRRSMLTVFETRDAILGPVNAFPALEHGSSFSAEHFVGFSYTMTHNLTGWPAAVVRCGTTPEGLPIGVQVVAAPWREDIALAIAQRLEALLGGYRAPELGGI